MLSISTDLVWDAQAGTHNPMDGKKHMVAFSGGKDSAAMLLRMIELKMPIDAVYFCDTLMEFQKMYDYVEEVKTAVVRAGIEFVTLTPQKSWDDWFFGEVTRGKMKGQQRGWPLMLFHCYWSREAKFKLMDPIMQGHHRYIGFAADETKRVESGRQKDGYHFPLADWGWTEAEALKYLRSIGWARDIHFDFKRTGCFLCPKQGMESLKTVCEKYPHEWDRLMWYARKSKNEFKPGIGLSELEAIQREVDQNKIENRRLSCLM